MKTTYLISAAALTLASSLAPSAWAHAKLEAAEPKAGSTVSSAPHEIRLQFNETLELPFSKVRLVDARDVAVEPSTLALDKANPKTLAATMPALSAGPYRVQWSTMTRDGHKVKGEYSFNVN